jgi:acyl transferase domain-containing protein
VSNPEIIDASDGCDVAIIGLAGRFPKAPDVDRFWRALEQGMECVSHFSDEELELDLTPEELRNPNFVKAKAILDDVELFDAPFFNVPAREAEFMDPQQRIFLECVWTALENAGCDPERYEGPIAVYAGSSLNSYMLSRLPYLASLGQPLDSFQLAITNDKDHLATRASYKLNLRGESLTVQTACSTSLVAVHLACQSLLSGQCDIALAGGVSVYVPQKAGYLYKEGMVSSPDGRCRAFDHKARGTVSGNGVGVVVLKMLSDAVRDGDYVHAVIKGSAINNDGRLKMGYTAPSVEGQAGVIAKALAMAGVDADSIGYVEAHGTGTPVGDPIEVEALTQAFRQHTSRSGYCALGAVKSNIGHLDAAAGVAGLIKTVLVLKRGMIPPTLHFEKPNPAIAFAESPFYVNNELREWKPGPDRRRAGVSSFGIGGTNAHVILEEAPPRQRSGRSRAGQILTLSAKTPQALARRAELLAAHLEENPELDLADVAYTQNVGRCQFNHRSFVAAGSVDEAVERLRAPRPEAALAEGKGSRAAFMFPGQGAQSIDMGKELYGSEAAFSERLDRCAAILKENEGLDLLSLIYPKNDGAETAVDLARPEYALPALFAVEYALAEMWMGWGVRPAAMIGHSFGEYVAACVAGVFSLEDGLKLAAARGRLMKRLEPGGMLEVRLSESDLEALIGDRLAIAAVNTRERTVVSGPLPEIARLESRFEAERIGFRRLDVPFAYHSSMVESIAAGLRDLLGGLKLNRPSIPYISSLTGDWIESRQATDPRYWADQMRHTVRFAAGVERLLGTGPSVLLEVGPGQTLTALAKRSLHKNRDIRVLSSLNLSGSQSDAEGVLRTLGQLWLAGSTVDWRAFYRAERRQTLPLPTYSFDRKRYWIDMRGLSFSVTRDEKSQAEEVAQRPADREPEEAPVPARGHEIDRSGLAHEFVAPRNEVERKLAEIWGEVLGLEGVGAMDNFFDLGGDSLLATQVYARVKHDLGANLSLQQSLSQQTIAGLAQLLGPRDETSAQNLLNHHIRRVSREGHLPLSFAQRRLWFIDQSAPGNSVFNLGYAVRLTGKLDLRALRRALDEIVGRHESLRTTFPVVDGRPAQVIAPPSGLDLLTVDMSGLPEPEAEARVAEMAREEARRPFDLGQGPLVRATLIRLADERHVLLFSMHHIVTDGWSFGVLVRELVELYRAFSTGQDSPLAPLPIQYADYAHWQRELLEGGLADSQLAYWKRQLQGALPVLDLPHDRPRPSARSFRGATLPFAFGAELTRELKALAHREGVTLFTLLLAAFQTLLHRYSGQDDIIVGSPIAGRTAVETEGLIGLFLNTLALRADCSGDPPFRQFLAVVGRTTLDAFSNQDVPFDKLVEALQPGRSLSHTPIFQVFFNFQNTPPKSVELEDLTVTRLEFDNGSTGFDLILNLTESDEALNGAYQYSVELFDRSRMERMAGHFERLLADVAARPEARLGALEIYSPAERLEQERGRDEREGRNRAGLRAAKRKTIQLS